MIVVRIELWPKGDETKKKPLGMIGIANDASGNSTLGNYTFSSINKAGLPYRSGSVKQFPRKRLLAFDLLFRVLREMVGDRNPK